MMQFQGFKPEAMNRIAKALGHEGDMGGFQDFLEKNPEKKDMMEGFNKKAVQMMQGGYVKGYAPGGAVEYTGPQMPDRANANQMMDQMKFGDAYNQAPLPARNRASYDKAAAEAAAQRAGGFLGQVVLPGEESFEDYMAFGPLAVAPSYQVGGAGPNGPNMGGPSGQLPGMGLDNFGPGMVDPRMRPPPGMSPGVMTTGNEGIVRSDYVDPRGPRTDQYGNRIIPEGASDIGVVEGHPEDVYVPPQQDPRVVNTQTNTPTTTTIGQSITDRAYNPQLPQGAVVQPVGTNITTGQLVDPNQGQVAGDIVSPISSAATGTAQLPTVTDTNQVTAATSAAGVAGVLDPNTASQGQIADESQVEGQLASASAVSNLNAAQGTGILMSNPTQRKIESGELVSGVANAETASNYAEKIQAAQATPTKEATIQGQLEGLMQAFEGGNTPAWAAGALRNASAEMAARGLGASSMAGQAMVQAAMESALPIAQADASVIATFEAQNLSNRQQRAMLAAEQRATFMGMEFDQAFQSRVMNASKISDIANMNFTAEQQVALENSRIANTVNLSNLNNKQAMVMAEASALANIDMSNLSNRQQAAVQNAQSFLQMDMVNLTNRQQTNMFKAQQRVQSLFTDQAAVNASRQFNASSANQTDQFFANLRNTTAQFNTSQVNAQEQFNSGEANAMNKFSAEIMNQRDQFNAQNRLVIDQSNAQWRREVATADTVAVNRANELNANSILEMSNTAYNDLWQYYADSMEWAWTSADNTMERMNALAMSELSAEAQLAVANAQATSAAGSAIGNLIGTLGSAYISGMFPATKFIG